MTCKLCEINPVYKLLNGEKLCKTCFIKYFENKVFKTIRKFNLFELDDKLGVAVSGGKDSITVLYLTHKYLSKKNLQNNVFGIAIDEGIEGYRSHTLEFLEKFCKTHKINLNIYSYEQLYGKSLDSGIKSVNNKKLNISPCNLCGTFRRNSINTKARDLGATKVVTGHNLDDEAQSIMLNIFKNNFKILARLGPDNGVVEDEMFVPRVKPLYLCTEKEVRLYTILKGFDVGYDECPYATGSFRQNIGEMLNRLEDEHKGVKHSVVNFYLETKDALANSYVNEYGTEVTHCTICGEPSQKKVCNTCELKQIISDE